MKTPTALLTLLALLAAPAGAVTPSPQPSSAMPHSAMMHKVKNTLVNPGAQNAVAPMRGSGCIGPNANAAQTAINPITGQPQAATIVSVPLGSGSGTVASSTNHAQQSEACAHAHTHVPS